jgi:hypothetical protein
MHVGINGRALVLLEGPTARAAMCFLRDASRSATDDAKIGEPWSVSSILDGVSHDLTDAWMD